MLKKIVKNIFSGFFGKFIVIALSLIVPKLILENYGSETNGLFTTINNVYSYLAIVEAGIATSSTQLLYKYVASSDKENINNVLYTTKKYFRKSGYIYLAGIIVTSTVLPFVITSSIGKVSILLVSLLQGFASVVNFFVIAGMTALLSAEGKEYVTNNVTTITTILVSILKIILVNLKVDIVVIQFFYLLVSLLSTAFYLIYFKIKYPWLNRKNHLDNPIELSQKNSFLIHNIVYVIFNNTDTILITIICGLKFASIYAIYNLVFVNLISLINSLFNGLKFTLGQQFNKDRKTYIVLHDTYKSFYCAIVFSLMTVSFLLITPFIRIYTKGIDDIQYVDKYLPLLFCLVNLLSACRSTENNLINLSFSADKTLWRAVLEAIINLSVSIVAMLFLGIYGCLIGTIVALLYRTNDMIIYANKKILNRSPKMAYLTLIPDYILFLTVVFFIYITDYSFPMIDGYLSFIIVGLVLTPIFLIVFFVANFATNLKGYKYCLEKIKRK